MDNDTLDDELNNHNHVYEKKYFCFDLDNIDDLAFYTGETDKYADDTHPITVYRELEELLGNRVPNLDIGASESHHIIYDCPPEQRETFTETIRQILSSAGWIEIDDWGCRKG
jgi:hypothetical protein